MNVIQAFSYPPILRGFIALVLAGCFFPLAGVFVLRLNLVTLRFTLMHAALLGAAVGPRPGGVALGGPAPGGDRAVQSVVDRRLDPLRHGPLGPG